MRKLLSAVLISTVLLVGWSSVAFAQYAGEQPTGAEQAPADAAVDPGGAQALPRTGTDSLPLARIAAVLVTVGGLLVLTARQQARRRAPSSVG